MRKAFTDLVYAIQEIEPQASNWLEQAADVCIATLQRGGTIHIMGNGGSWADAMHFSTELNGFMLKDLRHNPLAAHVVGGSGGDLSCIANDAGWEMAYTRLLTAHWRDGDTLLVLTTSGKSKNLLHTLRGTWGTTLALTGPDPHERFLADDMNTMRVPGESSARIQELQMVLLHELAEIIIRYMEE